MRRKIWIVVKKSRRRNDSPKTEAPVQHTLPGASRSTRKKKRKLPVIATFQAGGVVPMQDIARDLGAELVVIDNYQDAQTVKFSHLLLLGGPDVHPHWYGETNHYSTKLKPARDRRDLIEYFLVRRAMATQVPMMGICRGHQFLNVIHGGSLYQDLAMDEACQYQHQGQTIRHRVSTRAPLAEYLPVDNRRQCVVNSRHHQAVKVVAPGFKILAQASDGVIESIWKPGVLGVQWHPEDMAIQDDDWMLLFWWFISGLGDDVAI